MRWFWVAVWNTAELTGWGLGRFAPFVFGRMIGAKPIRASVEPEVERRGIDYTCPSCRAEGIAPTSESRRSDGEA